MTVSRKKSNILCAWILDVPIGLFLLDSDFIQNKITFMEDQIFVGFLVLYVLLYVFLSIFQDEVNKIPETDITKEIM